MRTIATHLTAAVLVAMAMGGCQLYFDQPQGEEPRPAPEMPPQAPEQPPAQPPGFEWRAFYFPTFEDEDYCGGERFIRYAPEHDRWVGAEVCEPGVYKLFMSEDQRGTYYEIADYAGHGQDHCELVNQAFRLPNEDDITSGGCADCALGPLIDPIGVPVYARGYQGEPFELVVSRDWADLTTTWYRCGVLIP